MRCSRKSTNFSRRTMVLLLLLVIIWLLIGCHLVPFSSPSCVGDKINLLPLPGSEHQPSSSFNVLAAGRRIRLRFHWPREIRRLVHVLRARPMLALRMRSATETQWRQLAAASNPAIDVLRPPRASISPKSLVLDASPQSISEYL